MPPECSQHSWFWRFISLMLSFIWSCENPAMQSSYHSMSHTFSALATAVFEKAATARAPTSTAAYLGRLNLRRVDSIIGFPSRSGEENASRSSGASVIAQKPDLSSKREGFAIRRASKLLADTRLGVNRFREQEIRATLADHDRRGIGV